MYFDKLESLNHIRWCLDIGLYETSDIFWGGYPYVEPVDCSILTLARQVNDTQR